MNFENFQEKIIDLFGSVDEYTQEEKEAFILDITPDLIERYKNDKLFHSVVLLLQSLVAENKLTNIDLRSAVKMAEYLEKIRVIEERRKKWDKKI